MRKLSLLVFVTVLVTSFCKTQIKAITDRGEEVILYNNGKHEGSSAVAAIGEGL